MSKAKLIQELEELLLDLQTYKFDWLNDDLDNYERGYDAAIDLSCDEIEKLIRNAKHN